MAQSIDNDLPMLVAIGPRLLEPGDPERRQVLDALSSALGRGSITQYSARASIHVRGGLAAVKLIPEVTDASGRNAPLVGGVYLTTSEWEDVFLQQFVSFGHAAGRPLDLVLVEDARAVVELLKKKANQTRNVKKSLFAVLLLILVLVTAMLLRGWVT